MTKKSYIIDDLMWLALEAMFTGRKGVSRVLTHERKRLNSGKTNLGEIRKRFLRLRKPKLTKQKKTRNYSNY